MNEADLHDLLDFAALGDAASLAALYDEFATDTYSVCAHYVDAGSDRDEAMTALWLHLWEQAPRLANTVASVRTVVLVAAHAYANAFARERRAPELHRAHALVA